TLSPRKGHATGSTHRRPHRRALVAPPAPPHRSQNATGSTALRRRARWLGSKAIGHRQALDRAPPPRLERRRPDVGSSTVRFVPTGARDRRGAPPPPPPP